MAVAVNHRPYPAPTDAWIMRMSWHDLLFVHWPVPIEMLRRRIPSSLSTDTFDGQAWIGVVPFRMSNVTPRGLPDMPKLSAFPELNVRTYVSRDGKPGVWFFSLDAANRIAVKVARSWFKLPYYNADMACGNDGRRIYYSSHRTHRGAASADFVGDYGPIGSVFDVAPGTLEYFLTARYCLYTDDAQGRVYRGEIDHPAWPLQLAEADIRVNTMTQSIGIELPTLQPLLHFAHRLDVVAWALREA